MAENYEKAEGDYLAGAKYKDIATKYGVSVNTVKSWRKRYGWSREGKKGCTPNAPQNEKRVHPKKEKVAPVQPGPVREDFAEVENGELSERQRLFCLYYVKYRNQVKAYQKAYQCSYENACTNAHKVWKNKEVQTEIKKLLDEVHEGIKIDIEDLIQQQIDIARADIMDFVDVSEGFVKIRTGMDGTLIREIKESNVGISVKLYDKQKAIDWLAKSMPSAGSGAADDRRLLADVLLESKENRSIEDFEEDRADEHTGAVQ